MCVRLHLLLVGTCGVGVASLEVLLVCLPALTPLPIPPPIPEAEVSGRLQALARWQVRSIWWMLLATIQACIFVCFECLQQFGSVVQSACQVKGHWIRSGSVCLLLLFGGRGSGLERTNQTKQARTNDTGHILNIRSHQTLALPLSRKKQKSLSWSLEWLTEAYPQLMISRYKSKEWGSLWRISTHTKQEDRTALAPECWENLQSSNRDFQMYHGHLHTHWWHCVTWYSWNLWMGTFTTARHALTQEKHASLGCHHCLLVHDFSQFGGYQWRR